MNEQQFALLYDMLERLLYVLGEGRDKLPRTETSP